MSGSEPSDSPQLKLMDEWHKGFQNMDVNHLAGLLHDDFHCTTYPLSLKHPDATKEQWIERTKFAIEVWTHLERTIHSVIDLPGKVITHYSGKAQTPYEVELHREAITIATIVADEDENLKIIRIDEFIDSKTHLDSVQALKEAMVIKK